MPHVLTVDDSRAIRTIVARQMEELGLEVSEAEDGEKALQMIEEFNYDLILLDVTMPVLDGPGMLTKMRESGNKTPVLMLTSEAKRAVVASVIKMGISDYILKPFKPEELKLKVQKILRMKTDEAPASSGAIPVVATTGSSKAPAVEPPARDNATRQFIDILVVDDMENVPKKLRSILPPQLTVNHCVSAQSSLTVCRERIYRVVLIDSDIPDVNSTVLMNQLRAMQPHAVFLLLALRTRTDIDREAREKGFEGVLYKPFDRNSIEDFVLRYFDTQDLLVTEDNVLSIRTYSGRGDEYIEQYFNRLRGLIENSLEKVASACFEDAIIDITHLPLRPDRTPRLILDLEKVAKKMGVELKLVGSADVGKLLSSFTDTNNVPFFNSISQARNNSDN